MLSKNVHMPMRESTASSLQSTEDGHDDSDAKPNRKRKRKGLGNWTRTTLACIRCRKMKIRVLHSILDDVDFSVMMLDPVLIVNDGLMNV